MKDAQCSRCKKLFEKKNIYTIQQFQYREKPDYESTKKFLNTLGVGEWDSLCEECMKYYAKKSSDSLNKN